MLALVAAVVLPLSLSRRVRQLESAAAAGVVLVAGLAAVVVRAALAAGLPAIASGELPLLRVASPGQLPEAVGVLSFAFFIHPLLLPLLGEMPPGRAGARVMRRGEFSCFQFQGCQSKQKTS
jgi:sodium-coupled neutral amino acid transporter 11